MSKPQCQFVSRGDGLSTCRVCGRLIHADCDKTPCRGWCSGEVEEAPRPAYVLERLAICRACPHLRVDGEECCGRLKQLTSKAGLLMHPKGVPNPKAKCPDGRWCEVEEA